MCVTWTLLSRTKTPKLNNNFRRFVLFKLSLSWCRCITAWWVYVRSSSLQANSSPEIQTMYILRHRHAMPRANAWEIYDWIRQRDKHVRRTRLMRENTTQCIHVQRVRKRVTTDIFNAFEQRRSGMRTATLCADARFRFPSEGPYFRLTLRTKRSLCHSLKLIRSLDSRAFSLERTNRSKRRNSPSLWSSAELVSPYGPP